LVNQGDQRTRPAVQTSLDGVMANSANLRLVTGRLALARRRRGDTPRRAAPARPRRRAWKSDVVLEVELTSSLADSWATLPRSDAHPWGDPGGHHACPDRLRHRVECTAGGSRDFGPKFLSLRSGSRALQPRVSGPDRLREQTWSGYR
jgi:hypothetical protein